MTDFRALCAELVDIATTHCNPDDEAVGYCAAVLARARVALAQTEPQGPTDEELCKTLHQAICDFPPTHPSAHDFDAHQYEIALEIRKARAILQRFGRPAIEPVPQGATEMEIIAFWSEHCAGDGDAGILRLARFGCPAIEPVPVSERLPEPGIKVLAHYFNSHGKSRTVCARWIPAKFESGDSDVYDDDFLEYDEESDTFYWPEAWYEEIENWDDYGSVKINEGKVTHWQPLPHWALPVPQNNA